MCYNQRRFKEFCDKALQVRATSPEASRTTRRVRLERDKRMVEDCTEVITLWNPTETAGDLFHILKYAKQLGRPITNLWKRATLKYEL